MKCTQTHIKNNFKHIGGVTALNIRLLSSHYSKASRVLLKDPKSEKQYLAKYENLKTVHFQDVPINNVLNSIIYFQDVPINSIIYFQDVPINSIIYFLVSRSYNEFLEISLAFAQDKLSSVDAA